MPWALACSLEGAALWALASGRPVVAALLHLAAASASAGAAFLGLRDRRAAAAAFVFVLFMPALGVPGLCIAWVLGGQRAAALAGARYLSVSEPELPATPLAAPDDDHDAAPAAVLAFSKDPHRRRRAVLSARRLGGRTGVNLLSSALRDPEDDVRLLSYALLQTREAEVYAVIQATTARLAAAAPAEQAVLHRQLALAHWDLAFQGLVQGAVLKHTLDEALRHAGQALHLRPADGALRVICARAHLRRGDAAAARRELQLAHEAGLPWRVLLPWVAEAAFRQKRFGEVRTLLAKADPRSLGPLKKVFAAWQ